MLERPTASREPVLNLPSVIVGLVALLVGIHAARLLLLSPQVDFEMLFRFAFLPLRYAEPEAIAAVAGGALPGGEGAKVWSFVTYALLHGSVAHVAINCLWLAVFGSALARRFGTARFLVFSAIAAAAGAALHLATHFGEIIPVVGASAAISGHMAAAARFVFESGGPLGVVRRTDPAAYRQPATSLLGSLANPRVLVFLGVWFGVNLLFGLGSLPIDGEGPNIAWEAHIGGFLAGLALFSLFDPVPRRA